ncbi:MAG TPA: class I SAM-dependent methyltransferase [Verrucomicrobiae bacterium]|nr:class I SAM-dependent methyltransferase [Verrucomicrobiae bacterium]
MNRRLEKEWLDEMSVTDPRAVRSRRDLRKLNAWMGNARILAAQLARVRNSSTVCLADIGAGDAYLLLRVARRLGKGWQETRATLVDQQNLITPAVLQDFRTLGWQIDLACMDVLEWSREENRPPRDIILANLFLHHFEKDTLAALFQRLAARCTCFIALEPRRGLVPLLFSHLIWFIGCNSVTRHDAPVSVRAGFANAELSALWPNHTDWSVWEKRAGPFGHLFVARMKKASTRT